MPQAVQQISRKIEFEQGQKQLCGGGAFGRSLARFECDAVQSVLAEDVVAAELRLWAFSDFAF